VGKGQEEGCDGWQVMGDQSRQTRSIKRDPAQSLDKQHVVGQSGGVRLARQVLSCCSLLWVLQPTNDRSRSVALSPYKESENSFV